jgi:hypothetical protein
MASPGVKLEVLLLNLIAVNQTTNQALAMIAQHQAFKEQNKTPKLELAGADVAGRLGKNGAVPSQAAEMAAAEQQLGIAVQQSLGAVHDRVTALMNTLNGAAGASPGTD